MNRIAFRCIVKFIFIKQISISKTKRMDLRCNSMAESLLSIREAMDLATAPQLANMKGTKRYFKGMSRIMRQSVR